MKKIIYLSSLLLLFGCTGDFHEINKSSYGIDDEDLKSIPKGGSNIQDAIIWILPDQENGWQHGMDMVGNFSGYCSANNFIDDFNSYTPREAWNDYPYTDTYKHLYSNYNPVKNKSGANYSAPEFAIMSVIRCAISQRLTDMYGPLPYKNVDGIKLKVPYDSQRDIYMTILEELKSASESLDLMPSTTYIRYAPYDAVYGGNMKKWAKYARSLMLRMSVRIAKQEPEKAREYAEYAVSRGVIETNADNALKSTNDNPAYKVSVSWVDSRVSADIVEYMLCFDDPRTNKYFTPVFVYGNKPKGLRSGSPKKAKDINMAELYSTPNISNDSPIVLFSAAETAFLKAEAALHGWNMASGLTAEDFYKEGIKLSFEQWNVYTESNYAEYLRNTNKRGPYTDEALPVLDAPDFHSDITVNWEDAASDTEKQLSKIITQKWIAMFPYNTIEAWTEWRRTGYPNLMPSVYNRSGGEVKNITQKDGKDIGGMRRLRFGEKDRRINAENVRQAVMMLGGEDSYSTDLWWAK